MLSRGLISARPALHLHLLRRRPGPLSLRLCPRLSPRSATGSVTSIRHLSQADIDDPNMNGGYVNPPAVKRQHRDPHADWWDKQERRNFGEPVHEDNDLLGIFTPYEYTHTRPGKAALQLLSFVAAVCALAAAVSFVYPDRPAVPREFPGGLEEELGGPKAVRARAPGDPLD